MSNDQEKMKLMIEAVTRVAKADGKITSEEASLLESVQISLMVYDQYLAEALDDGIITDEEKEMLVALKQQIIDGAWDVASISEGVSEDELKMLDMLLHSVKEE